MLYRLLIILLLIDALILVGVVLLQAGKGGGLAASFGGASAGDQLFGARQAGNLLTKMTWWTAGIFLGVAFIMQLITATPSGPTSILDQTFTAPATAPAGAPGAAAGAAPPLPTTPVAPTPAPGAAKQPDANKQP